MIKIDATVKKETTYIAVSVIILSVLMQSVFLILGEWNAAVLFGNLLSGVIAILNFFLMGLTVQKAVLKEPKESKAYVKGSQSIRSVLLLVTAAVGVSLPIFNTVSAILPLFFPRIAIAVQPFLNKKSESHGDNTIN